SPRSASISAARPISRPGTEGRSERGAAVLTVETLTPSPPVPPVAPTWPQGPLEHRGRALSQASPPTSAPAGDGGTCAHARRGTAEGRIRRARRPPDRLRGVRRWRPDRRLHADRRHRGV